MKRGILLFLSGDRRSPRSSMVMVAVLVLLAVIRLASGRHVDRAELAVPALPNNAQDRRVTKVDIAERISLHGRDSYVVLYNVMKSVSAALIVLAIAHVVEHGQRDVLRVPLLVASFLAVVQTYLATTIGSHLLPGRVAIPDVVLPLLLTLTEAWPIALLGIRRTNPYVIHTWGLSMSFFAAAALLLVGWVAKRLRSELYEKTAWNDIVGPYRESLMNDALGAALLSSALLAFWLVTTLGLARLSPWWQTSLFAGVASLAILVAMFRQQHAANIIRHGLAGQAIRAGLHYPPHGPTR